MLGAQWITGLVGQALDFNGSDNYVSIADSGSLNYNGWSGASAALWMKPGRLNHFDEQTLYGHWNASSGSRPFQVLLLPDNRLQCRNNHNNGAVESITQAVLDTWTHVSCVWTPAGLTIYIDGLPEATDLSVEAVLDDNAGLHTFGAREKNGALSQFFLGTLDEWGLR